MLVLGWKRSKRGCCGKKKIFFNMQTIVIHHYLQIFNKERFLFPYVSNNGIRRKKAITFTNAGSSFF